MLSPCYVLWQNLIITNDFINVLFFIIGNLLDVKTLIYSYYMYMDISGNVALMPCDRYWSKQTIKPCSNPNLANPDGNILTISYKEDASNIVTRVKLYDSNGNAVDFKTGESEESEDED